MKSIEVSAKSIEEAVSEGLSKLGCSISDCRVEVLQEGAKGLFGFFGSKPATVRLTMLTDGDEGDDLGINLHEAFDEGTAREKAKPAPKEREKQNKQQAPAPKKAEAQKPEPEKRQGAQKNKMRIASTPQVVDKPSSSDVLERFRSAPLPGAKEPREKKRPPEAREPRPVRAPKPRPAPAPELETQEDRELEAARREPVPAPENIVIHPADTVEGIAQQFLLGLTERMGVNVQVEAHIGEDNHLYATMYGDTLGILIGRRGDTLDAIQYLTSLQVNKGREEYVRVTLDTENYRAKREEALVRLAARMANRAVKTGRKVSLEPMNPYERRILHSSLQGNPNVTTHSEGDEPYRHVVVVPDKSRKPE